MQGQTPTNYELAEGPIEGHSVLNLRGQSKAMEDVSNSLCGGARPNGLRAMTDRNCKPRGIAHWLPRAICTIHHPKAMNVHENIGQTIAFQHELINPCGAIIIQCCCHRKTASHFQQHTWATLIDRYGCSQEAGTTA